MQSLPFSEKPGVTAEDFTRFRAELVAQFASLGHAAHQPIPWPAFVAEILDLYRPPLRRPKTFAKLRQVLGHITELLPAEATTDLMTTTIVAKFITSRPPNQCPGTTKSLLNSLRAACSYAVAQGYLRVSPFSLRKSWIRVPIPSGDTKKHHSAQDIERVLALGRETIARKVPGSSSQFRAWRTYAVTATAAYTGMRKMEIFLLWTSDLDFPQRVIRIVERAGNVFKTPMSAVPVIMPDALASILTEYLGFLARYCVDGKPLVNRFTPSANPLGERQLMWLFPNAYRTGYWQGGSPGQKPVDRLKRLGERAGIKGFTFLSLRHSWASHAESKWGFSEPMIQRQLRHTTVKTQKLYRHLDPENMRSAMRGIGFGNEQPSAQELPAAPIPPLEFTPPAPTPAPARPIKPRPYAGPKLDHEDVLEMRELRSRGWTFVALCSRYGIAKSTLHAALYGLTHAAVPGALQPETK